MTRRIVLVLLTLCLLPVLALAGKGRPAPKAPGAAAVKAGPVLECPASVGLGEPFLLRVRSRQPLAGLELAWLGRTARLSGRMIPAGPDSPGCWEAVALLGTDVGNTALGRHELALRHGRKNRQVVLRAAVEVLPVTRPVERLELAPEFVSPPREAYPRIQAERALTQKFLLGTLSRAATERGWSLPLARPVPGEVSSGYGIGRILNGQPRAPHRGLDLEAATGQPVLAAADGVVLFSGELYYAGNAVYLDHGQGLATSYFHLSERRVATGMRVARGQELGLAGDTGRSTRSHLHFGVWTLGRQVDPEPLFLYDPLP